jgi:DNA-binding CsgD family transcriptional regulator/Arc/MetJ-type ribon-helix-helix transcriptional regulator
MVERMTQGLPWPRGRCDDEHMAGRAATQTLIARATELAALRTAVDRASSGDATTVLVAGEAGVGKSRLVEELMRTARDDGALVLLGRCVDVGDGELAYAPIAGALRSLSAHVDGTELDVALGPGRAELARLVPDLAGEDASPAAGPGAFGKARLFELLLGTLGRLGQRRPVVLVVEDLHWADGSTRDLMRFLVRSSAGERLALIATYRTDDIYRMHPLRPYLVELRRDARVERIDLARFSRAEFTDHVAAILGTLPSVASLDRLYERSEGNAFFTEELLAAAGSGELPASLRDALAVHLERLPPPAQRVVRVMAAAGRRVDHRLLERVAAVPADELSAAVRAALDARVIVPARDGRAYEFRHALLREAAYAELLPSEREALHAVLARELEADPELGGAAFAGEVAHHWHAAGERERALVASVRAGREAERVYAHPEALRHFQRALELWERAAPRARAGLDRVELAERAAEAASATGETQLAIALAQRAVELAEPERAGRAGRAGPQYARLARLLWDGGRGADALSVSARAIALTPPDRTAERARMLECHARLLLLTGRAQEAQAPIDEAIAIARELGDPEIEAATLATRIITMEGRADAGIAAGREALLAAQRCDDPDSLMRAYINAGEAFDHGGRVQDAIDLGREGIEHSRRLGMERAMGMHMQGEIAGRLVKLGRYEEAAEAIEQGLRLAPEGTAAVARHHAAAALAARRGDAAAAEAAEALSRASATEAGTGQSIARGTAALAELALWDGDAERAGAIVEQALALVRGAEYVWYSAPLYALGAWALADRALRARAAGADRDADEAHAAARGLLARLDDQLIDGGVPEVAAYRAQAHAELTRLVDAPSPAAWEDARRRWEWLGFPFHAAVCGWREAEALLLTGTDRERAAELLADARREAEALGARPLAAAVEALARRARIAIDVSGAGMPEEPPAGLTQRELEVLCLVAEGQTNRQIGAVLFISEKTVSVHVSRVLAKLGAANRAQAATIAHRLGIAAPPQ